MGNGMGLGHPQHPVQDATGRRVQQECLAWPVTLASTQAARSATIAGRHAPPGLVGRGIAAPSAWAFWVLGFLGLVPRLTPCRQRTKGMRKGSVSSRLENK